jgi:hypothetical protein
MEEDSKGTGLSNVIRIDDDRVREHLGHIVRGTVEETLNAMLEAEAEWLWGTRGQPRHGVEPQQKNCPTSMQCHPERQKERPR